MASNLTDRSAAAALGLDSAVSHAMFMAGPALAAGVATLTNPAFFLPGVIASVVVMALVATLDTTLPGQLDARGMPRGYAGPLLATLAGASTLASLTYGGRLWPGRPADHAMVAGLAFAIVVAGASPATTVGLLVVAIVAAGVCQAPALVARNLDVGQTVPAEHHPMAYSILYASGGVGYALSSLAVALVIDDLGPARPRPSAPWPPPSSLLWPGRSRSSSGRGAGRARRHEAAVAS
ncbi:hypothetical protein [Kytococcus sp. Marseille-QA3725]